MPPFTGKPPDPLPEDVRSEARPRSLSSPLAWLAERWAGLTVVLSVLSALVAVVVVWIADHSVSFADESDYLDLSTNVARSGIFALDGVTSTAFRPPGFPLALSVAATV